MRLPCKVAQVGSTPAPASPFSLSDPILAARWSSSAPLSGAGGRAARPAADAVSRRARRGIRRGSQGWSCRHVDRRRSCRTPGQDREAPAAGRSARRRRSSRTRRALPDRHTLELPIPTPALFETYGPQGRPLRTVRERVPRPADRSADRALDGIDAAPLVHPLSPLSSIGDDGRSRPGSTSTSTAAGDLDALDRSVMALGPIRPPPAFATG